MDKDNLFFETVIIILLSLLIPVFHSWNNSIISIVSRSLNRDCLEIPIKSSMPFSVAMVLI